MLSEIVDIRSVSSQYEEVFNCASCYTLVIFFRTGQDTFIAVYYITMLHKRYGMPQ